MKRERARSRATRTAHGYDLARQLREHLDNSYQQGAAVREQCGVGKFEGGAAVDKGSSFKRRASGDGIKASLVGRRVFAGSFCDIEWDRERGTTQLVGKIGRAPGETLHEQRGLLQEADSALIDVKFLEVEISHQLSYRRTTRKKEAKLCFTGHAITENRNGLVLEAELTQASGTAEREAAIALVDRLREHDVPIKSLGADKGYFAAETVNELRSRDIKPHIAPKKNCAIAGLAGRTIKSKGFKLSQFKRKLVEECFGFMKTVAGLRKSRFIGVARTAYAFSFALGVYDLVRIAALCGPP